MKACSTEAALVFLGLTGVVTFTLAVQALLRLRISPQEKERRRRLRLLAHSRVADGVLVDLQDHIAYYRYTVAGVDYHASQDLSFLRDQLPVGARICIGPASVRYSPKNPANSIIACEQWFGFRLAYPNPQASSPPDQATQ